MKKLLVGLAAIVSLQAFATPEKPEQLLTDAANIGNPQSFASYMQSKGVSPSQAVPRLTGLCTGLLGNVEVLTFMTKETKSGEPLTASDLEAMEWVSEYINISVINHFKPDVPTVERYVDLGYEQATELATKGGNYYFPALRGCLKGLNYHIKYNELIERGYALYESKGATDGTVSSTGGSL